MILLALSYLFWGLVVRKKANKKQKIVTIIATLLLGYLSLVPATVVVKPGDGSAGISGLAEVMFVNTPYAFFVFFVSWLLVYFFRNRRS